MALDFLRLGDCSFYGPALPEPYVRFELEKALAKHKLLPDSDGLAGQALRDQWDILRRKLRDVSPNSGPVALTNRILDPLVSRLGYAKLAPADSVLTREGDEAGGVLMTTDTGAKLRCWAIDFDADLDAPTQRGYAYRFSPVRIAQRVLLASGERVGLLTNGVELRLLLCDPTRPDSHIEIDLNVWRLSRDLPDGYQLLLALASPKGIVALPEIVEDARLKQNKVTKELRVQARLAVEEFVQAVLDHPDNAVALASHTDKAALAKQLWHEGLVVVYRLLFVLKCESTSDPSRVFRFASTPLWRHTYSPSTALARMVRRVLDEGAPSGRYLEDGLRVLFKLFAEGLDHPGMTVRPLGGVLFGAQSTPLLASLRWGELAVAHLLNRLLWSDTRRGRERVHYGPLDVEDLGRVYEALLELEPGIATEPMCRLRRQKLEVVVPAAQGEKYKNVGAAAPVAAADLPDENGDEENESEEEAEDDKPARGKKTKVEWIEAIAPNRFYLRVGLGRKSTGSFYTPHSFVRFLVQETLGPQCDERSPRDNPDPGAILKLKVLDPACGSGHFLVEACRFLAGRVYEAARLCDELASKAEHDAEAEKNAARKQALQDRAAELRQRLKDLPDQEDELLSYLPSRSAGAEKAVLSAHDIARAEAICRRLVTVHCLYGADLNPLAVELARLSLWIESHAEGYPLTFLDHRIVVGNSLTGPFWEKLYLSPGSQQPVSNLFRQNLDLMLAARLTEALSLVKCLEASIGVDVQDIATKQQLKAELDARLRPFRILAAAWAGGVMLGTEQLDGAPRCDDEAYADLLKHVGKTGELPATLGNPNLREMIAWGLGASQTGSSPSPALSLDLAFPEVFHPTGQPHGRRGFDAVVGNPPWEELIYEPRAILNACSAAFWELAGKEADLALRAAMKDPDLGIQLSTTQREVESQRRVLVTLYEYQAAKKGKAGLGHCDLYRLFTERSFRLVCHRTGQIGLVLPSSFHANSGAGAVRLLVAHESTLHAYLCFENSGYRFFDIHAQMKFALLHASCHPPEADHAIYMAFDLHDDGFLFTPGGIHAVSQRITPAVLRSLDSEHLTFPEFSEPRTFAILATCAHSAVTFEGYCKERKIEFGLFLQEDKSLDVLRSLASGEPDPRDPAAARRLLAEAASVVLHEGETFHQYTDHWVNRPTWVVDVASISPEMRSMAIAYKLAWRRITNSKNERTVIASILPPPCLAGHSVPIERAPFTRSHVSALVLLSVMNAFPFDYLIRAKVTRNINFFHIDPIPIPRVASPAKRLLRNSAIRLNCNHAGYEPLWREQLGDCWREVGKPPFAWPVLASDDERWALRAIVDAVVADAYGLPREQYAHVLSTFSHASYKRAPDLCLAAFDELKAVGLEALCKKHDPYHDIPLVESLPRPVIDLPVPDEVDAATDGPAGTRRKRRAGKGGDGPALWEERSGQLTLEPPGPLFDPPPRPRPAPAVPDQGKVQAVRTLLELRKVLTSAEVQNELGIDAATARESLKALVEQGLATVEGKARGTRYKLTRR